jgi:glycosyltransferase involved in cell wall biosynthesis
MTSLTFRSCALIPTYDNPATIRQVVERVRERLSDVIVIDDGSGPEGRAAVEAIGRDRLARVVHRARNGGKGAAVKTGFAAALEAGFTHALQIDADGQHNLDDIPAFLAAAQQHPEAAILGCPNFDKSVPWARLAGRQLTIGLIRIQTGGRQIVDPMCGFRVYPLAAVVGLSAGDHMDFDIEVAVRLVWRGVPILNLPTKVRYFSKAEGGVSHFHMFGDNVKITWMHLRLLAGAAVRLVTFPVRALLRAAALPPRAG